MIERNKNFFDIQRKVFKKVQNELTPFEKDKARNIFSHRLILTQLDASLENFHLTKSQFEALIKTVKETKENYINIIFTELSKNETYDTTEDIYRVTLETTYKEYENTMFFLEQVIFSEKGNWGIFVSLDFWAILCGTENFIKIYKKNYPKWKKELEIFKENFSNPVFYNLENVEKLFNYVIENEEDLTEEDKLLPWKK